MQGWAVVAWVAGLVATVTALLLGWRLRRGSALRWLTPDLPPEAGSVRTFWWPILPGGLALCWTAGDMAVRHQPAAATSLAWPGSPLAR
jgi:hypothetical protein